MAQYNVCREDVPPDCVLATNAATGIYEVVENKSDNATFLSALRPGMLLVVTYNCGETTRSRRTMTLLHDFTICWLVESFGANVLLRPIKGVIKISPAK